MEVILCPRLNFVTVRHKVLGINRSFKDTLEGVSHMCKAMEELQKKSIERAVAFFRAEDARKMLKLGKCSVEEIAEVFGLTIDEVEALREDKSEILM